MMELVAAKIGPVFFLLSVLFIFGTFSKKSVIKKEFLLTELSTHSKGHKCPLKSISKSSVHSLWYKNEAPKETQICILKYLENNMKDGLVWSMLGDMYSHSDSETEANFCFKTASQIIDDFSSINIWHFLGPFPIGKSEFDGDPLFGHGGIQNVTRYRFSSKSPKYPSELLPNGEISWSTVPNPKGLGFVEVKPGVDWNDLVRSLSSMGITEWQGWIVGEFATTKLDQSFSVQCLGVARCLIDDKILAGDFYNRKDYWTSVTLSRGVHQIYIPVRAKAVGNFKFTLATNEFKLMDPSFLPQIYDGYLPKETYVSIPVCNRMSDEWLSISTVSVHDKTESTSWTPSLYNEEYAVAPGQVLPVIIRLSNKDIEQGKKLSKNCRNIPLQVKMKTSQGLGQIEIVLECRKRGSSFLFTFIDHDGSLQHAAAIEPLKSCPDHICPVLLSLHGTTVPPQNQADSYKKMVKGEFEFGVDNMWLLAPTRHGAHNWEGPGALTAMFSVEALHNMVQESPWLEKNVNPKKILFAGHSMGGHGALHLASHFPDRAIGLMSLAGWIKKDDYGDSNLFFRHDVATSHVNSMTKLIMGSCVAENEADLHVPNLKGIPVLLRVGAQDRTVHPYFLRRMYRLMKENGVDVRYSEVPNFEHWWWDTKTTNDGGCMNDKEIRTFIAQVYKSYLSDQESQCSENQNEGCKKRARVTSRYSETAQETQSTTFTVINPAFGGTFKGIRILQQIVPLQTSLIELNEFENELNLKTTNVKCLEITDKTRDGATFEEVIIDNDALTTTATFPLIFCRQATSWKLVDSLPGLSRNPGNYGPARRVAEREFCIVIGTQGNASVSGQILTSAVYVANQFALTSDACVPIITDIDAQSSKLDDKNIIIIGNENENLLTKKYIENLKDLKIEDDFISMSDVCTYRSLHTGVFTLAPHGKDGLALLLFGSSMSGLADVINLATPTIPPMARSPFSNLLPDFVITGPQTGLKGPGGFECMGFWDNNWRYTAASSSCVCKDGP